MKRNIIDSLMAGMLLSQLPVWQLSGAVDRITLVASLATLVFMVIMGARHEPQE